MTWEVVIIASVVCFPFERLCALIFPSSLAVYASAAVGSHPGSGQTDGDELLADRGTRWRTPLRPLPSGAEPRSLEWARRQPSFARSAGPAISARRPDRAGRR